MQHTLYIPCIQNESRKIDVFYDILSMNYSNQVFFTQQIPIIISNDEETKGTISEHIVYKNNLEELCQNLQNKNINYTHNGESITITRSPKYETIVISNIAVLSNKRLNNQRHYLDISFGREASIFENLLGIMNAKITNNITTFNELYIKFYEIDEAHYDHNNQLLINVELNAFQACKAFLNNSHIAYKKGALFKENAITIDDLFDIHCMVEV